MNKIKSVNTKYGKINIMTNDFIGKFFLKGIYWDDDNINKLFSIIPKNKNIIDIGANIGSHTLAYSRYVNDENNVYSFEPQQFIFENLLSKTISDNNITNVNLYNVAIGNKNTECSINKVCDKGRPVNYDTDYETNFGGMNLGFGGQKIDMKTLDSYNFDNIGFIKIDGKP